MKGTVIRMEYDKGYGFIRGDADNRARFMHARGVVNRADFDIMKPGDRVEFTPTNDGPKADGLRAVNVTFASEDPSAE
jgi:cold shock CspA family protein